MISIYTLAAWCVILAYACFALAELKKQGVELSDGALSNHSRCALAGPRLRRRGGSAGVR
jgi:hypothetical protein